jgi:predicted 3-demethylubiquinone-9 3-methyltransferase (glyoxalase superfamily)
MPTRAFSREGLVAPPSVFKKSKRGQLVRYGDAGPGPRGSVMVANSEIEGLGVTALDGRPLARRHLAG